MDIEYTKPDFVGDMGSFLIPAKDSSDFWKFNPRTIKDANTKKVYYPAYVVDGKVRVNQKDHDKIDLTGKPIPYPDYADVIPPA